MLNSANNNMYKYLLFLAGLFFFASCNINESLDQEPKELLTNEAVWNDSDRIESVLANYYDRLPKHASLDENWQNFAEYTDAMWSGPAGGGFRNNIPAYDFSRWSLWDYDLIRDINLAIENIEEFSTELPPVEREQFQAELRFQRAYMYFELVKRMGGVPIIQQTIDNEGDVESMRFPRDTEEAVYDFISSELDAIVDIIGNEESQTRANRWAVLALKSRAMLYAGSIAKYNSQMADPIETAGGEVGIPASRADDYFQQAFDAAEEIINQGPYSLYEQNTDDLGANFYEAITNENNNSEVIWAEDYVRPSRTHSFAYLNVARAAREVANESSNITPTLNLVEAFEYRDGSSGELNTRTTDGSDYIYYDNPEDIFNNKDARLYGTVVYPGSSFRDVPAGLQAGVKVWNSDTQNYETIEGDGLGDTYEDGGVLTGSGGPLRSGSEVSNTGFYLRKYISDERGASEVQVQAENWWIFFRLGEIYLNAAEAALELGNDPVSLSYVNEIRERAGFGPNSLSSLDMDRIRHERRVELAFEDHRVWDLKRWRIAHEVWNGDSDNRESVAYALYPYRVIRPGHPNDGTYVYDELVAPRFGSPRFFRMGNYYSQIPNEVLNNNPEIVRNPFH
ncbi:MAG: RagB/SusD family nutrient uptake outer membrane protein [Balneolaceae bacterium]|nr:RagB/SusD family nutrient uptake outer membrane protein [Balneolaceae bacterium]